MIDADWAGETVFIVGGGPSVLSQDLELLRGRKVVALNSSYERLPQFGGPPPHLPHIDVLVFGDNRWWNERNPGKGNGFVRRDRVLSLECPLVTVAQSVQHPRVMTLRKHKPPGLSRSPNALVMRRTTMSPAINYAALRAPGGNIVLLGADGKHAPDGRRNHYPEAYSWRHVLGCWDRHRAELETLVEPLKELSITVINASPGSAWDMWPVMSLREAIEFLESKPQRAAA